MATTNYPLNHPLAVKLWSKKLAHEALKETWASKFIGTGKDSLIQLLDDTQKSAGDRITVGLRMQLTGAGVEGDGTLEGNEEALTTYSDNLVINQLRHAVRSAGKMSEQRVNSSIREECRMGLQDWWSDRFDTAFFNQITGNTAQADTRYTGENATVAPNAENVVYVTGTDATGSAILAASSGAVFTLQLLDYAKEKAVLNTAPIRPLKVGGESKYVAFLNPIQVTSLRTNTNTGQWLDIQKAALAGGEGGKNPIYTGALGEYNGIILHASSRVPRVFNAADATTTDEAGVYRAVLCGAQACALAFGRDNGKERATWYEEKFDYGNQLGVSAGFVYGLKKLRFNSKDFGTIAIETFGRRR